jgi:hypothetical protein
MFAVINTIAILLTIGVIYWFWIRPILAQTPQLAAVINADNSFVEALKIKFAGIKQKLAGAVITLASTVVVMYDSIIPAITGVDITPLTSHIPSWAYPLIVIGVTWLLNWFRSLSEKREVQAVKQSLETPTVVAASPIANTAAPLVAPTLLIETPKA